MSFALFIALYPWRMLLRGWVLAKLWLWFIVPVFHLPPINWAVAVGVSILITLLTSDLGAARDKAWSDSPWWLKAISMSLIELFALGVGFFVHLFV